MNTKHIVMKRNQFVQGAELDNLVNSILKNTRITHSIKAAAIASPNQPWCVMDIHDTVYDEMGIQLNINDTDLFKALLIGFNAP